MVGNVLDDEQTIRANTPSSIAHPPSEGREINGGGIMEYEKVIAKTVIFAKRKHHGITTVTALVR